MCIFTDLSSGESGCGSLSSQELSQETVITSEQSDIAVEDEHQLATNTLGIMMAGSKTPPSLESPVVTWTPNWEEYGSYILSPQNTSTQRYLLGLPGSQSDRPATVGFSEQHEQILNHEILKDSNLDTTSESAIQSCVEDENMAFQFEIIAEYPYIEVNTNV